VPATDGDRYLIIRTDMPGQFFHLFVDHIHGMPVGIRFFFRSMGILLDQVFGIAEIKIPGQYDIVTIQKIIALYIQESVQKRSPDRIGASGSRSLP